MKRLVWELIEEGKDSLPIKQISRTRYYIKDIPNDVNEDEFMKYIIEDFNDRFEFKIWNVIEEKADAEED